MNTDLNHDLDVLSEIGLSILRASTDVDELAEAAFLETARLIEADFFQLGIFRENEYRTLIWVRDGNREDNPSFRIDPDREGIIGWIRRSGQPLLVRDFAQEASDLPAFPSYASPDPPTSAIFVPLQFAGRTQGIIAIQSRRPAAFNETHLRLLQLIALTVAPCLAAISLSADAEVLATRLYLLEEVSRLLISLTPIQERMNQVCNLLKQGLEYEIINLYNFLDDEIGLLASTSPVSDRQVDGSPICVRNAIESGQIQFEKVSFQASSLSENPGELRMQVVVPLQVGSHRLGALCLISPTEQAPSQDQLALIQMIVTQLGIALLEDRNYTQHQEEAWITTVLLEVARHAAQPGDALTALQAVLQLATLLAGTDWAVLLLPGAETNALIVGPSAGLRRPETYELESTSLNLESFGLEPPLDESNQPFRLDLPEPLTQILGSDSALSLAMTDGRELLGLLLLQGE